MVSWASAVLDALTSVRDEVDPEELVYLAATGKVENHVRNALAWRLHQKASPDHVVAREWRRLDLAVLRSGRPVLMFEAKAMYGFDIVPGKRTAPQEYRTKLLLDAQRWDRWPDSDFLLAALVTDVTGPVPKNLEGAVKYPHSINRFPDHPSDEAVATFISSAGECLEILEVAHARLRELPVRLRCALWRPIKAYEGDLGDADELAR